MFLSLVMAILFILDDVFKKLYYTFLYFANLTLRVLLKHKFDLWGLDPVKASDVTDEVGLHSNIPTGPTAADPAPCGKG